MENLMEIISDRISMVNNDAGTSIVISSMADKKKNRFVAVLLVLWVIGGILMIFSFPSLEENKTRLVVIIWLAFWVYFLYVLWRLWRWKQHGHEILKVAGGFLKYKKDVKGRGWVLDYEISKVRNLRASVSDTPSWLKNFGGDFWNTDCDSIRFDYEDREISFGYQLTEKERKQLISILGEYTHTQSSASKRQQKSEDWKKEN